MKLIFGILLVMALNSHGATLTLTAAADTSLFESNQDFNLGGGSLVSGTTRRYSRTRSLFRFDLNSLPAGASVTGAEVILHVTRRPDPDNGEPVSSDFSLHRLFVSWGEGAGTGEMGSVAALGDATWNDRHYTATPWGTPGGLSGVDYAETASASTQVSGLAEYIWGSTAALVDDVRAWQADPSSNFGFILISQSEEFPSSGRRFASKEQMDANNPPPLLRITYVIPEPSVAGMWWVALAGAAFLRIRRS